MVQPRESWEGAETGLRFLEDPGSGCLKRRGRGDRDLVLKQEAAQTPSRTVYRHRREMGGRSMLGSQVFPRTPVEGSKPCQPQPRPRGRGSDSSPSGA